MDMGLGCENLALTVKMSSVWILRRETECVLIFAFGLSNMDLKKIFFTAVSRAGFETWVNTQC